MGWLARFLGWVPKAEMEGIHLNTTQPHWEVDGPRTFEEVFRALVGLFPEDSILYFEGGFPEGEIASFLDRHSVPEVSHVAMGTIWPRPRVFHVPATEAVLNELAGIMRHHAEPELAIHFHVYRHDQVLLEWHDAFCQPMLLADSIPEEKIRRFANRIGTTWRRVSRPARGGE